MQKSFVVPCGLEGAAYLERTHISTYLGAPKPFRRDRLPKAATYYAEQFPSLDRNRQGWVSVHCCFHEERTPSLWIHLGSGAFRCFGCDRKGGDVLAFHQQRYGLGFVEAARALGAWGGV